MARQAGSASLRCMNPAQADRTPNRALTMSTPRWLHVLALTLMSVLAVAVIVLLVAFVTAGAEENLALVTLIFAVVVAVPLLVAGGLWVAGIAVRTRSPKLARALTVLSVVVGALSTVFVGWVLLASI